ncbi:MAG: nitrilase-related carbon-nitrogen hydrolase, partial [Aggregatilineales bacterium]
MAKLTISLAQMHIAAGDQRKNFQTLAKLCGDAAKLKSQLIVFPEL